MKNAQTLEKIYSDIYSFEGECETCPGCGSKLITDPLQMVNTTPKPHSFCEKCEVWFYEIDNTDDYIGSLTIKTNKAN